MEEGLTIGVVDSDIGAYLKSKCLGLKEDPLQSTGSTGRWASFEATLGTVTLWPWPCSDQRKAGSASLSGEAGPALPLNSGYIPCE